jgi:four helix bundle protein
MCLPSGTGAHIGAPLQHYLHIGRGPLTETQSCVHLAKRLGSLSEEEFNSLSRGIKSVFVQLLGLIKAVQSQIPK